MNELITMNYKISDEYILLIDDCKAILTEGIYRSRQELIDTYKQLGERIITDPLYKKWGQNTQGKFMRDLRDDIGQGISTLYYSIQFYERLSNPEKYPEFSTTVEKYGKNISWTKIKALLPQSKEEETPPLPTTIEGKYNVIYADPPWDVKAGPDWGSGEESKDLLYPTMTIEEISNIPVNNLADENAHLYLWVINKYIPEAYEIVRAWGFEPSCLLTWCKPPHGIGLGGTFIQTTEHLLFARKGTLTANKRIDTTWFTYPRSRHSEKPNEFRKMIEEVSPGKKIELFARTKSEGWDVWGNEV